MRTTLLTAFNTLKAHHQKAATHTSFSLVFISALLFTNLANAFVVEKTHNKTVAYAALGSFKVEATKIHAVSSIAGHKLLASVSEKTGTNFSMFLPFAVQQINYLVANGQYIEKNQMIAYLKGFDVHHFLDEYEAAKQLFLYAEQQYKSSKNLFAKKALNQSQWLESSKNYFAAKIRFEHLNHYKAFLTIDSEERIAIKSPLSGYVRYSSEVAVKQEGELLFDVIPKDSIRLKVSVPINNIAQLTTFKVLGSQCVLAIASKEQVIKRFSQTTWSAPLTDACPFTLGEQLLVIPQYQQQAFELPKTAIFEFDDQNYTAIKNDTASQFDIIAIEILGSAGNNYHVSSKTDLSNKQALVTSISALQGVLLELGAE